MKPYMNGTLFLILQQGYDEQHRQAMAEYAQHAPEFAAAYAAQAAQAFAEQQAAAYAAAQVRYHDPNPHGQPVCRAPSKKMLKSAVSDDSRCELVARPARALMPAVAAW